jgi:NAD(P)-dependent dehydrogenase (short-subunit alcohol dehydrogenase family)
MRIDHGTVALVTGAGRGIGAAVADRLRAEGATVVTADLAGAELDLDVRDRAAVRAAIAQTVDDHGRIDLAVACAGIGVGGLASEIDDADWDRSIAVNLTGTVNTLRAAYEVMLPRERGHLVALASLSGLLPTPLLVPYATSKGGVVSFTKSLRPEAARHGIGVSAVCPGPVDTGLLDETGPIEGGRRLSPRSYLTSAAGPAIAPAAVADALIAGVRRNRAVVCPKRARLLALAARYSPGVTERVIARYMRRELARAAS